LAVGCAATQTTVHTPPQSEPSTTDTSATPVLTTLGDPEPLFAIDAFALVDAAADLWPEHRPDPVICDGVGFHAEDDYLEVETGACNYAAADAPLIASVGVDDELELLFWHNTLASVEPTVGHAALSIDGALVWELNVEIPGDAAIYTDVFSSPVSAPEGATLHYHVHNHGENSWRLGMLTVRHRIVVE